MRTVRKFDDITQYTRVIAEHILCAHIIYGGHTALPDYIRHDTWLTLLTLLRDRPRRLVIIHALENVDSPMIHYIII